MHAWLMDSYEGVEKLRLGEVPDPQPGPGRVWLRIKFAALNPADAFLAQAMYPAKPSLPHILGRDGVGEVVAVGLAESRWETIRPKRHRRRGGRLVVWMRQQSARWWTEPSPLGDVKVAFARLAQGPMGKVLVRVTA
jgi:NADPH:quinone reductase-like Zn-dependent oxidoreductase